MKKTLSIFCLALMMSAPALADDDRTAGTRTPAHKSQSMSKQTGAKIDGWGDLKFGMSVDEVAAASPEIDWPKDACTTGEVCQIKPASHYVATIGGVGFMPELTFDRFGRLITIALTHHTTLPGSDCWGRFNTTMAGLEKRFGKFNVPMSAAGTEKRRTPGGSYYGVGKMEMEGIGQFLTFQTTSDVGANDIFYRNYAAENGLRAPRSFVSVAGMTRTDSTLSCNYNIHYNAADMEAPKGVAGSDNAGF